MNGHVASKPSRKHEESFDLQDEKSISDVEKNAARADSERKVPILKWVDPAWTSVSGFRSVSWRAAILRTGFFLLPSFVQSRLSRDHRLRTEKLSPTAYLDGMRGLAAFFVFFCHYFYTCFVIVNGYGYGEDNYYMLQLPFIRLFYSGPPMVCVFFVISGYALSYRPLKLIRSRNSEGFATTMTSFVFRRAMRLFLPTAISTFMVVILLRLGLYEWTRDFASDRTYMRNIQEHHPGRTETTTGQVQNWAWNMFKFLHIWGWEKFGGSTGYDVHLWTIPVEFRASMMLFLALIGTARLRTGIRFFVLAAIMWFTYRSDRWEMLLFYCGMVLAELDIIRGAHSNPATTAALPVAEQTSTPLLSPQSSGPVRRGGRGRSFGWIGLSIVALYLMSQPDAHAEETPGWIFLTTLIPEWFSDKYRYWQIVGSIIFVLCVGRSPPWQRAFNTPVVQYFGKISYAIYLMHGPVLHTFGYAIERWAWSITGVEGPEYLKGFLLAAIFIVPLVIWAADVFWRAVDAPVVRFSKWVEQKCSI